MQLALLTTYSKYQIIYKYSVPLLLATLYLESSTCTKPGACNTDLLHGDHCGINVGTQNPGHQRHSPLDHDPAPSCSEASLRRCRDLRTRKVPLSAAIKWRVSNHWQGELRRQLVAARRLMGRIPCLPSSTRWTSWETPTIRGGTA